jgi:hypothetical protein
LDIKNALQFFVALMQLCHLAHFRSFFLLAKFMAKLGVLPQLFRTPRVMGNNRADERKINVNELVKALTPRQTN